MASRLWVVNLEDVVGGENALLYLCRHIFCLEPGDAIISTVEIDGAFLDYASGLKRLSRDRSWLISVKKLSKPYSIAGSALADPGAVKRIMELSRGGDLVIEPYIETPGIVRFSRELGVPLNGTNGKAVEDGLIFRLNDKVYFKQLARELSIETVRGCSASGLENIKLAVKNKASGNGGGIILKKAFAGGGFGNLTGSADELLEKLDSWYDGGEVLVEPFMEIDVTLGSLVSLGNGGPVFLGTDRQLIRGARWQGCVYPAETSYFDGRVKTLSLRMAERFYGMGARGELNLDWGIHRLPGGSHGLVALEANLRHNGFGYILRLAKGIFGLEKESAKITYHNRLKAGAENVSFAQVIKALEKAKVGGEPVLAKAPGLKKGAAVTSPPRNGRIGLIIASEDSEYNHAALEAVKKALLNNER